MTRIILFSIVTFVITSCGSTQNMIDCSKFKSGKFKYLAKESGNSYIIERKDSIQIETNQRTGSITTLKIKWTNSCEYDLTYLSRQSSPMDTLIKNATKIVLKNKIIEVGKSYYIFSSQAVGMDKILTDTLKLIEP